MRWSDVFYMWIREWMLRRYLLGHVGFSARSLVERGYFQSPRLYERLMLVEEDLVISYIQGHLSRTDAASFEEHYLTSAERRSRVELARFLAEQSDAVPIATRFARGVRVRFILTAIMASVFIGVPLWYWQSQRTQIIRVEWSEATRERSQVGTVAPYRIARWTATVRFEVEPTDTAARTYVVTLSSMGTEIAKTTLKPNNRQRLDLDISVSKLSTGVFDLTIEPLPPEGNPAESDYFRFEVRMP